jgi:hypothetical protein
MYACTESDKRESPNHCILTSGEGHGSCGVMLHLIYAASPISFVAEHNVLLYNLLSVMFLKIAVWMLFKLL